MKRKSTRASKPEIVVRELFRGAAGKAAKEDVKAIEAELVKKYPHIRPGTLLMPGEHKDFPTKRSAEILCEQCKKTRRVATQDLFQVHHCSKECKKAAKSK